MTRARTHAAAVLTVALACAAVAAIARADAPAPRMPVVKARPSGADTLPPVFTDPAARERAAKLAFEVRRSEEAGLDATAARALGELRPLVAADPDLDLWLAIDLARAGRADTALAILYGPVLSAALNDTTKRGHFQVYGWQHEKTYFGGAFDGWYWYVARARLELEAARGRWTEALAAARVCTRARPLAGSEWTLRALCAAQAGALDEARDAAGRAARLAPILPEARMISGWFAWRDGRRAEAQAQFRAAVASDSTYRDPAVALVRARLPVPPGPLPAGLFHGAREAALLTSPLRPKYDEFTQLDRAATVAKRIDVVIPDSLASRVKPITVHVMTLFDERGRPLYHEDPWAAATSAPEALVGLLSTAIGQWRVVPAVRLGEPVPLWIELDVNLVSEHPSP